VRLTWFAIVSLLMVAPIAGAQTLGRPHPYLLYTDADIQQYRARLGSSPTDKPNTMPSSGMPKRQISPRPKRLCRLSVSHSA
jgi:hypothetical protein